METETGGEAMSRIFYKVQELKLTSNPTCIFEAARLLNYHGMTVSVPSKWSGFFEIRPELAPLFVSNPNEVYASLAGVSVGDYLSWVYFKESKGRCRGATTEGFRCKKTIDVCSEPDGFTPGVSDFCKIHRGEYV